MYKLFRISILVASVAIPAWAARDPDGGRGLRRALIGMALFVFVYWWVVASLTPEP
jgi:hypothetical protein